MQKTCRNCNQIFECKMDNITECSCYRVKLTDKENWIFLQNLQIVYAIIVWNYLLKRKSKKSK